MTAYLNNPAGRLLDLLLRGREIKPEQQCRIAWCQLLDVEPSDTALLTIRLGKAMALIDEIEEAVRACQNIRPETYLSFVANVEKGFKKQKLTDHWSSFISYVDVNTTNYVEMTSDLLSMQQSESVIEERDIQAITKGAEVILREMATSKIDDEIKAFLTRRLKSILEAAKGYRLTGASALYEIICSSIGELTLHTGMERSLKKTYTGKKFGELLGRVFFLIKADHPQFRIPDTLMSLLPEGEFVIEEKDIVEEV
ncbi:MAG: hypothetical protein JRI55_04875 [Deltaproteobacteria bacterium]|jgi:hypothetical protein|nr:hypothetical protein [Deltaproteobacteria bacterium]